MWTAYSTKDTAELVGLTQSLVRSCVREGLLDAQPDEFPLRFSFQDLTVLKTIKQLVVRGVSIRRARRQLSVLRARDPVASLASLAIEVHGGHVVIRDKQQIWRADSGQLVFAFEFLDPLGEIAQMPHPAPLPGPQFLASLTADEWFDKALALEESDAKQAMVAYQQVLKQRPQCTESLINLGRLHAEDADVDAARDCFEQALQIDPCEATALYNLGVIAQDTGRDEAAIAYYGRALRFDSELAEAHYNLATIFDKSGDARAAIRHINEFRKLSKRRN